MHRLIFRILSILLLAYPLGVYFSLNYFEPKYIGIILLMIISARYLLARKNLAWDQLKPIMPITITSALLCLLIILFNDPYLVRLNPVLINFTFLTIFSYTLFYPPSMVERLARLTHPDLPSKAIIYTKKVTQAWCVFFILNGSIAFYTCFYSSIEVWTLYNGLIAYLLMAMLFLVEYIFRKQVYKNT